MRIAVLSGKGGTGKTFVSVNLAVTAKNSVYIDCDVEEPNGRLFLKPEESVAEKVYTPLPQVLVEKCIGCRKCVDSCRFNAIGFIKNSPLVFPDVCHACGACSLICPAGAVYEVERPVGVVERGRNKGVEVITGILNIGEASGIPVIQNALDTKITDQSITIIDCPPGSACSVMESVKTADYCLMVVEATTFGFYNFKMVYELVSLLQKPCGVVINKGDFTYSPLIEFCTENNITILCCIPYQEKLARLGANGELACEKDDETRVLFTALLDKIRMEVWE